MRTMRTINAAAECLREKDPDTALTRNAIRNLVLSGQIPHVKVGNKRLVAMEDLELYLETGTVTSSRVVGAIRPVEVRL